MSRFALALLVVHGAVVAFGVLSAATAESGADIFVAILFLIAWFGIAVPLTAWLGTRDWILPEPHEQVIEQEGATT